MSRIGKKPIELPSGVKVAVDDASVRVEGPKGKLEQKLVDLVKITVGDKEAVVERIGDNRSSRSNQGLMRSLLQNMVTGVHKGYERALEISGVGYRAEMQGNKLVLQIGYSHNVEYDVPKNLEVVVEKMTRIVVRGIDAQAVGQAAATIRAFKIPDPYKVKGVMYEGEQIKRKAGKKAVG